MNSSNPTFSDQNPLGMSKPGDFSRGRSNSAAAGVGSFEYHTFQGNKILGSLDSVSSSTGCRDGNDSFSTQERSEEFSSQRQQHEKNQKEQYQHPCMLNQQSSLFLRPTRNNNIIGNLPSSQAANTINSNRQFTSSSLNSSRDVGQPHFELKSKYQEQLKQQSFQQKSSRLGFDVQSSIQNNGLFESSARLPFSTLTDNSKNASTNIPASSLNNFEPSKNPPFQSLLQSSLKGKENDAFKQPNYSNFMPSASNKLFEFNPINYSNDGSNTGFNSTLNTNYLGQTNNIHLFNNKNSNYINNNPISSQDSNNNNIQWRRMISESNGISSNQDNNQFCNMTGSIGRKQPIFNQTTSSLVSNVSQLSNQHSIGQTHQNNINDLFVSRKMSFDNTSSKFNNKPADMSEILNYNINNRTTEYKNYRNLSLDGSKQKSSSSMLQNNQCEPVINAVKVTPNGYFNSNYTNQNHPYFSSQQQQNPQQRPPKPPSNTQNINSSIGSSGQKAKQLNEKSNISSIYNSSDHNQTLLSCHKISDVLKKKQNINIPPDILSYDQDQFPQQVFFLLSEEDKNISSFRERIEREKSKINKDIDHAKKEIDNLLEDLKMEMTQGVDEHFKQLMDIYKAFKGQVIEFKSVKSDLPPFQMPQNASLSSISGKSSSSQNGSSSNAKLIEELQDMRYKAHMSRLYQYIGEIQKSTLAKIQGSSQNLLKLLSNSNQLYNSEGSQQQLTEIKNAFALSLSARFDPLSSFVRAVQIDTPEVIGQINSNSQGSIMNSNNSQLQSTQQCISLDNNQIFSKDIQALQTDQINLQQQQMTLNQQQTLWGQKHQEQSILNQQIQSHNFFSDSSPVQNIKNNIQPQLGLELDNISNPLLKQQLLKQQQQLQQSRQLFQLPKSQELQQQQFQQQDKFNQQMMMQELEQQGQSQQSQQLFNFHPTERPSFGFQQDCLSGEEEQQQQELQIYNQPFALKPPSYAQGQDKNYLPGDPSVQSSFKQQYTSPTELRQFSQPFAIQHGEDEEVAEQQINLKENQL